MVLGLALRGCLIESSTLDVYGWYVGVASMAAFTGIALSASHEGCAVLAPLRAAPVVFLGTISYGPDLFHFPITLYDIELSTSVGVQSGPVLGGAEELHTAAPTVDLWHVIEKPVLRFKRSVP
ncbi:MAG: hypothetical protein P4L84_29655 [Isosphaeraceae bacterium]|nr:hypothetical protein [Isosphaeraceae bacterium]